MAQIREPGNFYTHAIPAVGSIPAFAYMAYVSDSPLKIFTTLLYGGCFLLLFTASSLYHSIPRNDQEIRFWQKIDHAGIYLMIAGTYTPTVLLLFSGWLMWTMISIVWAIAVFGVITKLSGKLRSHKLSLSLYLAMGWLIVLVLKQMFEVLPGWALFWLFFGGFFYTAGAYFYSLDKKIKPNIGYHEIWHVFVFAGAACHYYYTLYYLIL